MNHMTPHEIDRYSRQIILPEVGIAGQAKLKAAKVLLVGAGGLGCPVLQYLAAAGVGTIGIADHDVVTESNLHRQILYSQNDCGGKKADLAAKKIKALNPLCNISAISNLITADNAAEIISEYDIVMDGSDNFATKYLLNDACVAGAKTLIAASIERFSGQLAVYNAPLADGTRSATYRCLFPEPPYADDAPSCSEIGVIGVLPGIVGSIMAGECIKLILGCGELLTNKLLIFDALTLRSTILAFSRHNQSTATTIQSAEFYQRYNSCKIDQNKINLITPDRLKDKILNNEIVLLDVRTLAEHEEFNIGGICIEKANLLDNLDLLPRDKEIVVYCKSGMRSADAASLLLKQGYQRVFSLQGGLNQLQQQKL